MPPEKQLLDLEEKNVYAALCYVVFFVFVSLFMKKTDPFVNWHIRQGLVILGLIILSLIASAWQPRIGNMFFLLVMIVNIIALVQALIGRKWKIPLIGNLAEKFSI